MADSTSVTERTSKFCPFMGVTISDDEVSGVYCLKSACQLWIPINTESYPDDEFAKISGNILQPYAETITPNPDGGICGATAAGYLENLYRLKHHQHHNHLHPGKHNSCEETVATCGSNDILTMPKSTQYAQEIMTGENYTGLTGLLYGKDYMVTDTTSGEDLPPMVQNANSMITDEPYNKVPWEFAKNDKFPPMLKYITPSTINYSGKARMKFVGGYYSGNTALFEVSFGVISGDSTSWYSGENINIVDERTLFVTAPVFPIPETTTTILVKLKNSGNTAGVTGLSALINIGDEIIHRNRLKIKTTADDTSVLTTVLEEEAAY